MLIACVLLFTDCTRMNASNSTSYMVSPASFELCLLTKETEQCRPLLLHKAHHRNIVVASLIISAIAIVVNMVEIRLIYKKQMRSTTECVLLSLSVADLMTATCFAAIKLNELNLLPRGDFVYILILAFTIIATSIMHIFLLTIERVIAIVSPFWHKVHITPGRIYIALIIIWLHLVVTYVGKAVSFKMKIASFDDMLDIHLKFVSIAFFVMSIIILTSYAVILKRVKSFAPEKTSNQAQTVRKRKERRLIITSSLISGICFICYLPYTIVAWISLLWIFRFQFCLFLPTLLNPLVYFFSNQCIKKVTKQSRPESQEP